MFSGFFAGAIGSAAAQKKRIAELVAEVDELRKALQAIADGKLEIPKNAVFQSRTLTASYAKWVLDGKPEG